MGIWSHSVNHFFCLLIHVHLNTDVHLLNRSQSTATYTPDPPKARESSRSRTLVCGTILIPFPSPQQYWYTQFNLYISNEKVTGNNNLYWLCNPTCMYWKTFQENPKIIIIWFIFEWRSIYTTWRQLWKNSDRNASK